MVSNKENRSDKPKSEGEKHQGVGANPAKHKEGGTGGPRGSDDKRDWADRSPKEQEKLQRG
jgi:hypothetical protein